MLAALAAAACAGETVDPVPRDAGPLRDAGPRDSGPRDSGTIAWCGDGICHDGRFGTNNLGETCFNCPEDCVCHPDGFEGGDCASSFEPGDTEFARDGCADDLLCIPWDIMSGRDDLLGPLQTCVRPCETDRDCGRHPAFGTPRFCTDGIHVFGSTVSVAKICVDELRASDEYCGASNNSVPRAPGVDVYTPNAMVGCDGDARCAIGLLEDINPDEGVCLQFCDGPDAPPCPLDRPYCNPHAVGGRAVCSQGRFGVGSWCGKRTYRTAGLTAQCDTSTNTPGLVECVDLALDDFGLCLERCDTSTATPRACEGVDPTHGPLVCVPGEPGLEFCGTPSCSIHPDTCDGAGGRGLGQYCQALGGELAVCVDRLGPAWNPGHFSTDGDLIERDDCFAPDDDLAFARCPEPSTCFQTQTGGTCLVGCSTTAVGTDQYCLDTLPRLGVPAANARCVDPMVPTWESGAGICGGD